MNDKKYELKKFYYEWEKFPKKYLSKHSVSKSNFGLFHHPQFTRLMASSPVITFVINHRNSTYEFFSENCYAITGYTAAEFKTGGVPFGMSITDPAQTRMVAEYLIPKVFEFSERYAQVNQLEDLRFSYNYRIIRKDGQSIWTLHLMTVIETDDRHNALLTLVQMIDITHLKKDEKVDFCVSKKNGLGVYETIYMASFPEDPAQDKILSKREIEILSFISQGESSKSIADKLNLSVHTINNHRKRILQKTGCKNSSEVINYGRCKGIALPYL